MIRLSRRINRNKKNKNQRNRNSKSLITKVKNKSINNSGHKIIKDNLTRAIKVWVCKDKPQINNSRRWISSPWWWWISNNNIW